jgi:phosphohistidine phosphatase
MQLLIIRHAIAQDRVEFARSGRPDAERPLTDYGRRRMRKNARGLRRVIGRPDVLATSPLARAEETARILAETLGVGSVEPVEALVPERRSRDLLAWLQEQPAEATVAVVGHEPHLGTLVTWLMSGREAASVTLKKGGACLLDLGERAEAGTAVLQWLLTPAQLRAIAD